MEKTVVLVALVDALRHDYLNEEDSPFLFELTRPGILGSMKETFAFELRPAFFAGLHPEECGIANMFYYDPGDSPFAGIGLQGKTRAQIDSEVKEYEKNRGNTASARYGFSAEIPIDLLPNFSFSEKKLTWEPGSLGDHPTVFDFLRREGREWLWLAYPLGDLRTGPLLADFQKKLRPEHSLVFLHFAELDWIGHGHGPDSEERRRAMREIDDALRRVIARLNRTFGEVRILVFGDHGMVPVQRTIDLEASLRETGLKLGKDYLYFLDSTQARFWFFEDGARNRVRSLLEDRPGGRLLDEEDLERLRYRFPDKRFGEEIFVVEDRTVIFPNFFQRREPPRGMHGYLPEVSDNWAACLLSGIEWGAVPGQPFSMVRLFPTILSLLGIEASSQIKTSPLEIRIKEPDPLDLSVIIPTYNRCGILEKCLEALAGPQGVETDRFEILVVDDGSGDDTARKVSEFRGGNPALNVRYLKQENSGPARARNLAVGESRGRIVLFMNDDTLFPENSLKAHLACHDSHPGLSEAILGRMVWAPEVEITPFRRWLQKCGPLFALDGLEAEEILDYRYLVTANLSLKKTFLDRYGGFDEDFKSAMLEDTELGYRLKNYGLSIFFAKEITGHHLHHITLEEFCERQKEVGRYTFLLLRKHPRLLNSLAPQLTNPLLFSGEGEIQRIMDQLVRLEDEEGSLEAIEKEKEAGTEAWTVLSTLYAQIVLLFQARGFIEEIGRDPKVFRRLFEKGIEGDIWEKLGFGTVPAIQRLALLQTQEKGLQLGAQAREVSDLENLVSKLESKTENLSTKLHELGLSFQELQNRHEALLDQYQDRQDAVDQLAAEIDVLNNRPEKRGFLSKVFIGLPSTLAKRILLAFLRFAGQKIPKGDS